MWCTNPATYHRTTIRYPRPGSAARQTHSSEFSRRSMHTSPIDAEHMQHHATCKYMQRPSANGECRSRSCSPGYPLPSMDNFRECRRSQESRSCKERRCHRSRRSPPLPCSRSFAPERCSEEKTRIRITSQGQLLGPLSGPLGPGHTYFSRDADCPAGVSVPSKAAKQQPWPGNPGTGCRRGRNPWSFGAIAQ